MLPVGDVCDNLPAERPPFKTEIIVKKTLSEKKEKKEGVQAQEKECQKEPNLL